MGNRDKTLDAMRCLAMLWVIMVHAVYWGCFFGSAGIYGLLSLGLFEMPLFFFITGASNSLGREEGYRSFVYRRFRRILVPYWVFGVLCAGTSMAAWEGLTALQALKILGSWLIPWFGQITTLPYLKWIVWFVPVYLCVVLALPVMKRYASGPRRWLPVPVLAAAFLGSWALGLYWVRIVVFYCLWTYLGLFYRELRQAVEAPRFRLRLRLGALGFAAVLAALLILEGSIDLQDHKFPPTPVFLVYSCAAMCGILSFIPGIGRLFGRLEGCAPGKWLTELYSKRSTTIFLYQVFAFTAVVPLTRLVIPGSDPVSGALATVLCFALAVPACAVLAVVFGRVEGWGTVKQKETDGIS